VGWQLFFSQPLVDPNATDDGASNPDLESSGGNRTGDGGGAESNPGAEGEETPSIDPDQPEPPPSTATQVDRDDGIWVETDLYRARLSNYGATIVEMYSKVHEREVFDDDEREEFAELELLQPYCLDMDEDSRALLFWPSLSDSRAAPIATSAWKHEVAKIEDGEDHTFRFDDGAGTRYEKILRFRDGRNDVEVMIAVETDRDGAASYELIAAGNATDRRPLPFTRQPSAVVVLGDDEMEEFTGEHLYDEGMETVPVSEPLRYFGSFTNHFAMVLRPDEFTASLAVNVYCDSVFDRELLERHVEADGLSAGESAALAKEEEYHTHARSTLAMTIPLGGRTELNFLLFAGPKDPNLLDMDRYSSMQQLYVEDYGNFGWINRLLLFILRGFHSLFGNWGIAIILLTVLVKICLFPVMRMQSRSMEDFQKKMAKLKPRLDELKAKYKSNVRKFQEEQQKIMRENKVRPPVMGCLIIVLQFPVFIGLFQILKSSFELRHQPFFGWIADLSQPDALPLPVDLWLPFLGDFNTLNLLPLLMIAAMVFQFKCMPKPKDEQAAQVQKMMMIMPFGFGIFLYGYASGLSLYMLTNALLGIIQTKFFRVNTG